MIVSVRAAPVFAAAVTVIVAVPLPDVGCTVAHAPLGFADQLQAALVRMSIVVLPPGAGSALGGPDSEYSHGAASCAMLASVSAAAIALRRATGSGLAATRYDTEPAPCPLAADVSWIQETGVLADHEHSRSIEMDRVPVPPEGPNVEDEFVTEAWHRVAVGPVTDVTAELPHRPAANAAARTMPNGRVRRCFFTAKQNSSRAPTSSEAPAPRILRSGRPNAARSYAQGKS